MVISLDDAPGKSYRHEETTLRFRIIQDSAKQMQIEVILTQDPGPAASRDDRAQGALRHRFGFEDRDGHPLSWLHLRRERRTGERYTRPDDHLRRRKARPVALSWPCLESGGDSLRVRRRPAPLNGIITCNLLFPVLRARLCRE